MAIENFLIFRALTNQEIHDAVLKACNSVAGMNSARYFLYKGRLVIIYDWQYGKVTARPEGKIFRDVLAKFLPKKYQYFDIWEAGKAKEIPEFVMNKTGYVYCRQISVA